MSRRYENRIGKRLGRLVAQYRLRIAYGKAKAELYSAEAKKNDRLGRSKQAIEAKASRNVFGVYVSNLEGKLGELLNGIDLALLPYSDLTRQAWKLCYLEGLTIDQIADRLCINARYIQRLISRADQAVCKSVGLEGRESEPPERWSAADLAAYLTERPSADYVSGIADLLDYGAVDVTFLETDEEFLDWLASSKKEAG